MRDRTNRGSNSYSGRRGDDALRFAVQLALSQLSNGIGLAEAVQFAAKYHYVTCAAIEAELSKKRGRLSGIGHKRLSHRPDLLGEVQSGRSGPAPPV
jgi:hypothetical protein